MADSKEKGLSKEQLIALRGLRLPIHVLKLLSKVGIRSEPAVSIEYQKGPRQYVIAGAESGGAIQPIGAYCSFVDQSGAALVWLKKTDELAPNRIHSLTAAARLIRLQMVRSEHTYELLITHHELVAVAGRNRPRLVNRTLFHGTHGVLALNLWGEDQQLSGTVSPAFTTRAGDALLIPELFLDSVNRITAAVNCVGCKHCHLLVPPDPSMRNE